MGQGRRAAGACGRGQSVRAGNRPADGEAATVYNSAAGRFAKSVLTPPTYFFGAAGPRKTLSRSSGSWKASATRVM